MFQKSLSAVGFNYQELFKCFVGSIFIALFAQISIPLEPVPFTMQPFAILFVASSLGPKLGAWTVVLYLVEGIAGLPVFAEYSSGLVEIFGPTGGYLIGFVPAAYVTGLMLQKFREKGFLFIFLSGLVGDLIMFVFGYLQLAYFVGFSKAYILGVVPFLFADLLKVLIFSSLVSKRWHVSI